MKRFQIGFIAFALLLAACASGTPTPTEISDLSRAQQTLIDFFSLLSHGDYAAAAALHANDPDMYDTFRQNNPSVNPQDRAALLEAACTYQLRCMAIKQVVSAKQLLETEFQFVVEFSNPDGTLFILGPCCGASETEMPPVSQFEYRVEKVGSEFQVHGSPVYVP